MYATVTSKGQITLPAQLRRQLRLTPGRKVAVRVEGNSLVLDAPPSLSEIQEELEAAARANGTWGKPYDSDASWAAAAVDRYASS